GALNVADVDMRQVARSQVQVLVNGFGDDQHVVQAQAVQLAQQTLGLRSVDGEVFDHYQAIQTNQLGEDGAQSSAVHLLVQLLAVILRTSSEGHATATPDRTNAGTGTSTTGALLAPRLLATTGDFSAGFLSAGALTTASHVGDNSLVHQSLVELAAESALADFDSLSAIYIQLHLSFPY